MAINSKSVIPSWLHDVNSKFYDKLTDLENNLLANPTPTNQKISLPFNSPSLTDKSVQLTLTGNRVTRSAAAIAFYSIRATTPLGFGKWYWEVTINAAPVGQIMVGVATGTPGIAAQLGLYLTQSGWFYYGNNGARYSSNVTTPMGGTFAAGDTIGIALDLTLGTFYAYKNGVYQGQVYSGLPTNGVYPAADLYEPNSSITFNFGDQPFKYTVPAGYNTISNIWPQVALNSLDTSTNISISDKKLIQTAAAWNGSRAIPLQTGKWYWEVSILSGVSIMIGVCGSADFILSGSPAYQSASGWVFYAGSGIQKYSGNTGLAYSTGIIASPGEVIGVALDMPAGTITIYRNGISQGVMYSGLPTSGLYPAIDLGAAGASVSVNFDGPFQYPIPTGFSRVNSINPADIQPLTVLSPLANSLNAWKNINRSSKLNEFASITYGFNKFAEVYDLDKTPLNSASSDNIFTFNGAVNTILNASSDYLRPDSVSDPTKLPSVSYIPSYTNLNNLITTINGAPASDIVNMNTVRDSLVTLIQNKSTSNLLVRDDSIDLFKTTLGLSGALKTLNFPGVDIPKSLL